MIDSRIREIINFVPFKSKVADIGADHGYLSIELIKTGRADFVVATDKNFGPMSAAKKNISAENLEEKISVRQGDGLKVINPGEVDTICIAGMGGALICKILEDSPNVLQSVEKIILQPMNAVEKVEDWIKNNGWFVENSNLAEVDGIIYEIICAGKNPSTSSAQTKKFSSPLLKKYLEQKILKRQRVLEEMSKSPAASSTEKFFELQKEIEKFRGVILNMGEKKIPAADFAIIGGSGTLSCNFPNNFDGVKILEENLFFETPYGKSPAFKIFSVGDKKIFTCKMHGWRSGVTRADASRQIFWIFREAGVKRILSEGGVGSINHLLNPRDLMIPDDYLDMSVRKDVMLDGRYLLIMRDALCVELREKLLNSAKKFFDGRIFEHGIYAVTDGRHFESPAEISMLKGHADIVGQSLSPEVYLAREIGACYANLSFVVNYGEGIKNWSHEVMKDIFFDDAKMIGKILLDVVKNTDAEKKICHCLELRKETLLKEVYNSESPKG